MKVDLLTCSACGSPHDGVQVYKLAKPVDEIHTHWGRCPETHTPVLVTQELEQIDPLLNDLEGYYRDGVRRHRERLESGRCSPESVDHLEYLYRLALQKAFLELQGAPSQLWPFSKDFEQTLKEAKVYRSDFAVIEGGNGLSTVGVLELDLYLEEPNVEG